MNTELGNLLTNVSDLVRAYAELEAIVLRRLGPAANWIQTAACHPFRIIGEDGRSRPIQQSEGLNNWLFGNEHAEGDIRQMPPEVSSLLPDGLAGQLMAGPLRLSGKPVGVLICRWRHEGPLPVFRQLFRCLQEPLAAALVNRGHLQELSNLREKVEADNQSLLSRLDRQDISASIIGAETGLKEVCERIELVGSADVPILILGETGSGKEVVARALHTRSRRASGPFLRVNCGAIPPELIDSHLFGHERGSFSGADALRKGWFERADGGTLFLDEIGDLPLQAQVRLLRVLQDGTFERVGGQRALTVDVRIIAATHRDLKGMVAKGQFREDLWYRIAVFPIVIPPLRERKEDILALATHFALRAAKRLGALPVNPSQEASRLLLAYPWPGNVRELAAVMERAVIIGNGRSLEVSKALGLNASWTSGGQKPIEHPAAAETALTLDEAIASHIVSALTRTGGRIEGPSGAACLLAVNPHTLRAKMRRLGIDWKRYRDTTAT